MFGKMNHDLQIHDFTADRVRHYSKGGELWQGSAPPPGKALHAYGFDVLVLAAQEYQPAADKFPGVRVIHAPNDDAPIGDGGEVEGAVAASKLVADALRRDEKVLVTCRAGLNRSGLISALALARSTTMTGPAIVEALRRARGPWALSNDDFRDFVLGVDRVAAHRRLGKPGAA